MWITGLGVICFFIAYMCIIRKVYFLSRENNIRLESSDVPVYLQITGRI